MRAFRSVEFRRMRFSDATEQDMRWHRNCLTALISAGESLMKNMGDLDHAGALVACGVKRENIDAAVGNAIRAKRPGDAPCCMLCVPRLEPRAFARFQFSNDGVGYAGVDIGLHWFLVG